MFNEKFKYVQKVLNPDVSLTLDGVEMTLDRDPENAAPIGHNVYLRWVAGAKMYDLYFENISPYKNVYSMTLTPQRAKEFADFFATIAKFYEQEM